MLYFLIKKKKKKKEKEKKINNLLYLKLLLFKLPFSDTIFIG